MKASQLMGLDSSSQGPSTFKPFYASDRPPSRSILLSPRHPPTAEERGEDRVSDSDR